MKNRSSLTSFLQLFVQKKTSSLPILWSLVVPFFISIGISYLLGNDQGEVFKHSLVLMLIISIPSMAFALIPTTFIAFISGFFYGFKVLPFVVLAYVLASVTGYFLAGFFDKGWVETELNKYQKAKRFITFFKEKPFSLVFLGRLSPFLPFAFMNIILRYLGVNFRTFFFAGTLGMLPRTAFFVWLGQSSQSLKDFVLSTDSNDWYRNGFTILLIMISIIGILAYFRKAVSK